MYYKCYKTPICTYYERYRAIACTERRNTKMNKEEYTNMLVRELQNHKWILDMVYDEKSWDLLDMNTFELIIDKVLKKCLVSVLFTRWYDDLFIIHTKYDTIIEIKQHINGIYSLHIYYNNNLY